MWTIRFHICECCCSNYAERARKIKTMELECKWNDNTNSLRDPFFSSSGICAEYFDWYCHWALVKAIQLRREWTLYRWRQLNNWNEWTCCFFQNPQLNNNWFWENTMKRDLGFYSCPNLSIVELDSVHSAIKQKNRRRLEYIFLFRKCKHR